MELPKKYSLGILLGGAVLAAGGYVAVKRLLAHKELMSDIDAIPWDVPPRYSSWKRIFSPRESTTVE